MGHRNPFRIQVDQETGWLYNGEVGPDASGENANRGPRGYDELNQIREAGHMGWPYCIADNKRRPELGLSRRYPTAERLLRLRGRRGRRPAEHSAWNTGMTQTPPTTGACCGGRTAPPAELPGNTPGGNGRTAIAGPIYHFDSQPERDEAPGVVRRQGLLRRLVARLDRDAHAGRGGHAAGHRGVHAERRLFRHPQDIEMGADGSLYVLEWGLNFNYAG